MKLKNASRFSFVSHKGRWNLSLIDISDRLREIQLQMQQSLKRNKVKKLAKIEKINVILRRALFKDIRATKRQLKALENFSIISLDSLIEI